MEIETKQNPQTMQKAVGGVAVCKWRYRLYILSNVHYKCRSHWEYTSPSIWLVENLWFDISANHSIVYWPHGSVYLWTEMCIVQRHLTPPTRWWNTLLDRKTVSVIWVRVLDKWKSDNCQSDDCSLDHHFWLFYWCFIVALTFLKVAKISHDVQVFMGYRVTHLDTWLAEENFFSYMYTVVTSSGTILSYIWVDLKMQENKIWNIYTDTRILPIEGSFNIK